MSTKQIKIYRDGKVSIVAVIGSVLDLGGSSSDIYAVRGKTPQQLDAEALAQDWSVVGEDIRYGIEKEGLQTAGKPE